MNNKHRFPCVSNAGLVLMALAVCATLAGQEFRATITGTITDPQGAVIPGATVVAKNLATNLETRTTTNEAGLYVLPFLNTGSYMVTVSSTGFKSAIRERLDLSIGQRQQLDFKLELGGVTEQITVVGEAELLNMATASRGTTIDAQKIADLPLLGKNPYTFAYHAAGVLHINPQGSITDRPYDNGGMDYLVINGAQAYTNEFLLDGAPNTNTERGRSGSLSFVPPPEATEEMVVITNNYDAQYGRVGGGVVSATLKSGSNRLHGSVYEYHRNRLLNANTFQANRQNQPRGPFIWNQPGVTVNGPVYIPKLYDGRDRTFFLFSWEAIKQNEPSNPLHTVPTERNRTGDFSDVHQTNGAPIIIYDPFTVGQGGGANIRTPLAGNKVPQSLFDPISLKLMEFIPRPNFAPNAQGFQNYSPQTGLANKERYNAYTVKVDQMLTERLRFTASYVRNRRWQTGRDFGWPVPSMGPNNFQRFNQGSYLQLTTTMSATTVMTTRFGFTQHDFANFPNGGGFDPVKLGFPASMVSQSPGRYFPGISFTDYTGFGGAGLSHDTSTNWYLTHTVSKVVRTHQLRFGGEFKVPLDNLPSYGFASIGFSKVFTQRDYNTADAASGNAFASFLMGNPSSGSATFQANPAWGNRVYGVFIQDDWRATPTLTLNMGFRWDYDSPFSERYNRQTTGFDPSTPSNFVVPNLALKGGLQFASPSNRLTHKRDMNNFQPRVGASWRILPKTVLRGGYGLSYLPEFVVGGTFGFSQSTPVVGSTDANRTPATKLSVNLFPAGFLQPPGSSGGLATYVGQGITYIYQDRVIPYIQQYSFGFQHELPGQLLVDLSYVGSQSRKLDENSGKNINALTAEQLAMGSTYLNQTVTNPFAGLLPGLGLNSATTPRRNLMTPYPQFTSVTRNRYSVGKSWYNSVQLILTKKLSHGLHAQLTYSYSTTMAARSYLNAQYSDDQLERTRASEDLPHRLTLMAGYEFPFFKESTGIRRSVLGGWQIQGILIAQSGRMLTTPDAYPTGADPFISSSRRPDGYYFNACWVNTAGVRQATCASPDQPVAWRQRPTDTLRVTGSQWSHIREMRPTVLDSSVFKTFYPREGLQVQFRAEAFNTFNTPWFGQAQTGLTNARFGLLGNSQTNDARNVQFALKIAF